MKIKEIKHEFIEFVPDKIKEGVLYISIPYATASHKCACGCGEIIVTPIRPTDWILIWDRDSITLTPSIGNWSLPCQSHYFINKNKIVWAEKMSDTEINAGRKIDRINKSIYYNESQKFDLSKNDDVDIKQSSHIKLGYVMNFIKKIKRKLHMNQD